MKASFRLRGLGSGLVLAAMVGACTRSEDVTPPLATPSLSATRQRVALGSPLEVKYRFTMAPDARLDQNYRVLAHFLDSDEELMWTDDHDPPRPTTAWKPGETIEYERTIFVPIYPYVGEATVWMGLYSPRDERRLKLIGEDSGQRSYKVASLVILPQSENIFLVFKDGWHPVEVAPDNALIEWQWTKKEATISFRNPRRDALFYLHLDGRPDALDEPQRVAVLVGDQPVGAFDVTAPEEMIQKIPITVAQLGTAEMVDLKIQVDKTFVPARLPGSRSQDPRELGVRIFHAYLEPKG